MSDYQYALKEPHELKGGNIPVTSYEALDIHHPRTNREAVRRGDPGLVDDEAAFVGGELEAVRTRDGNTLVKKDLIFEDPQGRANVPVPAPIEGYVHYLNPNDYGGARIYSKPFGTPGAELIGQVLHMDDRTFTKKQGEFVQYGESLGIQSGTGPSGRRDYGIHAHVEVEIDSFKMYVNDVLQGRIRPGGMVSTNTLEDGKLEKGEFGDDVAKLKKALNDAGVRDAEGKELTTGKHFDGRAKEAVENYQRANNLPVTGVADQQMLQALGVIAPQQTQPPTQPTQSTQPTQPTQQGQPTLPTEPTQQGQTIPPTASPRPTQQEQPAVHVQHGHEHAHNPISDRSAGFSFDQTFTPPHHALMNTLESREQMTHPENGGNKRLNEVLKAFETLPPGTFKTDEEKMAKAMEATAATLKGVGDRPLDTIASAKIINGTIYLGDKPEINDAAGKLSIVQMASNRAPEESASAVNKVYPSQDTSIAVKNDHDIVQKGQDPNQANPTIEPIKAPKHSMA